MNDRSTTHRILVVDDESHILHVLSLKLGKAGYDVGVTALDGLGCQGDCLQARGTGAGAGHALHRGRQLEVERDLARHIRRALGQDDAAPDDAVDLLLDPAQFVAAHQTGFR